jgi:hypothetical protein
MVHNEKATHFQTRKNLYMSTENSNTKQSYTIDSVIPHLYNRIRY